MYDSHVIGPTLQTGFVILSSEHDSTSSGAYDVVQLPLDVVGY
jgi:hypothetical protein